LALNKLQRMFHEALPVVERQVLKGAGRVCRQIDQIRVWDRIRSLNQLNIGIIAFKLNRQHKERKRVKLTKARQFCE
jgi:hypothetical protein